MRLMADAPLTRLREICRALPEVEACLAASDRSRSFMPSHVGPRGCVAYRLVAPRTLARGVE